MKIQGASQWRWLLVLPAFLLGVFVPGFLIRFSWEMGSSWIPGMDFLVIRMAEFAQTMADGGCSVFFAGYVAPRRARAVRLVAATMTFVIAGGNFIYVLLNDYYQGATTLATSWDIVLVVTHILAAIATALTRDLPNRHHWTVGPKVGL